jgi:hypothetical protein
MSTLKTTFIQHPSATEPSIELSSDGSIVLPLSGIGDLADVDEGSGAADGDVLTYDGVGNVWSPVAPASDGFDALATITATNASWPVPSLGSPIVKVTVIGGGGGGGGCEPSPGPTDGGVGGTSSFTTSLGTLTALGGYKGIRNASQVGQAARNGFCSGNGGGGGRTVSDHAAENGGGGEIKVAYYDLTGISTANVVVGAGGLAGTGFSAGGVGGTGVVIVEYKAA